jgi:hypothetical protein
MKLERWEVPGLNLGWVTDYPEGFHSLLQSFQQANNTALLKIY